MKFLNKVYRIRYLYAIFQLFLYQADFCLVTKQTEGYKYNLITFPFSNIHKFIHNMCTRSVNSDQSILQCRLELINWQTFQHFYFMDRWENYI